jgi:hypothetical protein
MLRTFKIYSISNFQVYYTSLLITATMQHNRSPENIPSSCLMETLDLLTKFPLAFKACRGQARGQDPLCNGHLDIANKAVTIEISKIKGNCREGGQEN